VLERVKGLFVIEFARFVAKHERVKRRVGENTRRISACVRRATLSAYGLYDQVNCLFQLLLGSTRNQVLKFNASQVEYPRVLRVEACLGSRHAHARRNCTLVHAVTTLVFLLQAKVQMLTCGQIQIGSVLQRVACALVRLLLIDERLVDHIEWNALQMAIHKVELVTQIVHQLVIELKIGAQVVQDLIRAID